MCGICGILNTSDREVMREALDRLTDHLSHRGPDGRGIYRKGFIGLGHRRLAIIDPVGGHQPVANEDESIWLTFNGEIYNFRNLRGQLEKKGHFFRTRSDSEVIVHAYEEWGVLCVNHLRGMFAFGIWDEGRQELFLARDRIGMKPLCYGWIEDAFAFSSEIHGLTQISGFSSETDLQALDLYLHLQYIPAPFSIYKNIRKLPPAHWVRVSRHGTVDGPHRYWDIRFEPDRSLTEAQWVERLDAALCEAVGSHLVSDVPFGAFLSGGVDSSSVVAYMAKKLDRPVDTFAIGFNGWPFDEREFARTASEALGTRHTEEIVQPDALGILPRLTKLYGEPFGDSSAVCTYYVAQAARRHVKMVLSGDGGDETHAGYDYFGKILRQYPEPLNNRVALRRKIGILLRRVGLRHPAPTVSQTWYDRSPFFPEFYRDQLWHPEFRNLMLESREWNEAQFRPVSHLDVLSRCQYVDIHNYLVYDNLFKVDGATMAHGLEVRVPLVDHVLLDTVARIPPELRVRLSGNSNIGKESPEPCGKYLLKQTTAKFFPPGFYDRTKQGFSIPVSDWLAGPMHEFLRKTVTSRAAGLDDWFDMQFVTRLMDEHRIGDADHGHRLWSLLFLAEWRAGSAIS